MIRTDQVRATNGESPDALRLSDTKAITIRRTETTAQADQTMS